MKCPFCDALVWQSESCGKEPVRGQLLFSICCQQGRVTLPKVRDPPTLLKKLLEPSAFKTNIRPYNSSFAMTSMGAKVDTSLQRSRGPYYYRIYGQNYHRLGSLLPIPGESPRFLQLYIFDTKNEVQNRLKTLPRSKEKDKLDKDIIKGLIQMLDENNKLTHAFRMAQDRYEGGESTDLTIRLVGQRGKGPQYDLPSSDEIAGLIVGDITLTSGERDIIVDCKQTGLQRIYDFNSLYMPLQYPLLFPYGEDGYHKFIPFSDRNNQMKTRKYLTMREYYSYQLHTRLSEGMTIIKSGRLFHQYVVDAYTAIEQERMRYYLTHQSQLRSDVYNNVSDAVGRGDTNAKKIGKRIVLPSSFTGGPRYMNEKYHDAMGICKWYGNPDLFITMTANPN